MPCYYPVKGYRSKVANPATGLRPMVYRPSEGLIDMPMTRACGQCIGCRLETSRQWAIRCVHEARMVSHSSFITLTYNDKNLPKDFGLKKEDMQLFLKRLRQRLNHDGHPPIRYYYCGEYGETTNRPHYHMLLFGHAFLADREFYSQAGENALYTSALLDNVWGMGECKIGDMTFESAAYTARYAMKKLEKRPEEYEPLEPPFTNMSKGIGRAWFDAYWKDTYLNLSDTVVIRNGVTCKPPLYYDQKLKNLDPALYRRIKKIRMEKSNKQKDNQTLDRLAVREFCVREKIKQLERNL